ncbi:MAG: c-type cytochrome [Planctomycetes bacterium]|nr:c-type cytochrome [Planctomycetota bacterium]
MRQSTTGSWKWAVGLVAPVLAAGVVWGIAKRSGYAEAPAPDGGAGGAGVAGGAPRDGKTLFATHCAPCHGETGDGKGKAAVYLYPKPRDFTSGKFKVRTTASGQMPTDQDLFDTLTRGMPGTPMPSFAFLPEAERRALVATVKSLTARTDAAGQAVNLFEKWGQDKVVAVSTELPSSPASIARGRDVYAKLECGKCHGSTGRGDGPSSTNQKDGWGFPIKVRDFTGGVFVGGNTDRDLYLRFTTGLNGTPMPSYVDDVTDTERWDLVHYVQSLRRSPAAAASAPAGGVIVAARVTEPIPPDEPLAPVWSKAAPCEIPMFRLFQGRDAQVNAVVRALASDTQVAVRIEWNDPSYELTALTPDSFRDAAAVEFALGPDAPYLGMGSKGAPVNLWQWKADWQADMSWSQGAHEAHPGMAVDTYHFSDQVLDEQFSAGRAAGNPVSQRTRCCPVEDLNAAGFGTLTPQPAAAQNVNGRALWDSGRWTVLFVRPRASADEGDATFDAGYDVPIAFGVWDGAQQDRNGQKAFSTWYRLRMGR